MHATPLPAASAVTTALIGLIGVVIGGLLSGLLNTLLARSQRLGDALAAGRVIRAELEVAAKKLSTPGLTTPPAWWVGMLPTGARQAHFADLAARAPDDTIEEVATAYALIESWNAERDVIGAQTVASARALAVALRPGDAASPEDEDAPTPAQITELSANAASVEHAREKLREFLTAPPGALGRAVRRNSGALALITLIAVLLVPLHNVNAETVAAALEKSYGDTTLAECDRAADDWECGLYTLDRPRSRCLMRAAASSPVEDAHAKARCGKPGKPKHVNVDDTGANLVVYETARQAERTTAGEAERRQHAPKHARAARTLDSPVRSLARRIGRYFSGRSATGT